MAFYAPLPFRRFVNLEFEFINPRKSRHHTDVFKKHVLVYWVFLHIANKVSFVDLNFFSLMQIGAVTIIRNLLIPL
jgi:hypothetical protein